MWKTKIININIDVTKDNDFFEITAKYVHTDGRKLIKVYKIYIEELSEISINAIKEKVKKTKENLEKLDEIKALLETNFDKEI